MKKPRKSPKLVLRLQSEADLKYEVTVPFGTKVVDAFFGSGEDGWFVKADGKRLEPKEIE